MNTYPPQNKQFAPENGWLEMLEDDFPFGKTHFQGRTVSFMEGIKNIVILAHGGSNQLSMLKFLSGCFEPILNLVLYFGAGG